METSKNLTRQLTLDELIYSQEDSPAKTPYNRSYFQLQVSALARTDEIEFGLWPTPTFGMLPTPMAQEHDKITGKENQDSLTKRVREETGKTSQLSPLFVEEMMGFPQNWTALPFQSGDEKA